MRQQIPLLLLFWGATASALIFQLNPIGGPLINLSAASDNRQLQQRLTVSFIRLGRLAPELYIDLQLILRPEYRPTFEVFNYQGKGPKLSSAVHPFSSWLAYTLLPIFWLRKDVSVLKRGDIPLGRFDSRKLQCSSIAVGSQQQHQHTCNYAISISSDKLVADHRYFQYRVLLVAGGMDAPLMMLKGKSFEKIPSLKLPDLPHYSQPLQPFRLEFSETDTAVQLILTNLSREFKYRPITPQIHPNRLPTGVTLLWGQFTNLFNRLDFGCKSKLMNDGSRRCVRVYLRTSAETEDRITFPDPPIMPHFHKFRVVEELNERRQLRSLRIIIPKSFEQRLTAIDSIDKARKSHAIFNVGTNGKSDDECSVCFDPLLIEPGGDVVKPNCCVHLFHRRCLEGVIDQRCPLCRREI